MPLTRYQIRDEFRLADPELYRAADKDDPEALLEGVAMAGLVGVLRQLGDLAEFASEIFHNLHEEVMVTAARGHGLTLRVQQLEVEFLSIEKAFLSQTCHSPFLHNSGVEWHPNLRLDQSLITEGDLPRFVMDSYEDCRGPPRLFLLDKFDIAGAGACLKRYTDPSFFRAEFSVSEAAKEELKREKKARKVKRKGARWRAGENPELTASHSKLHQLLLEERCQSQIDVQKHRVKLKRRHSSNSVIHSTSIKNYMEKLLDSHSPDRKLACGSSSIPSRLNIGSGDTSGLVSEQQNQGRSPPDKQVTGDRNLTQSHGRVETLLNPLVAEFNDVIEERNSNKIVGPAPETNFEGIPSSFYMGEDKRQTKQIASTHASARLPTSDLPQSSHLCEPQALGWEKKTKIVVNGKGNVVAEGYHSDDANSEIENYTDALTTMDSEVETDTESKPKNEGSFKTERQHLVSETDELQKDPVVPFSESHAKGDAVASEVKNGLLDRERLGSYRADTVSNLSESLPSGGDLVAKLPSSDVSSRRTSGIRSHPATRSPEHAVPSESLNESSEVPSNSSCLREASGSSNIMNASVFSTSSPEASLDEVQIFHPNSVMIPSNVMDSVAGQLSQKIENVGSAGHDMSCMTNVSDIPSQARLDFLSTGPQNDQTLGMPDGRDDASNDISSHLFDILGAPHGVQVVKDVEEQSSIGIADDSHAYQMSGKFDSPDSVLLNTETEVYSLGEQYQEARLGTSQTPECGFYQSTDGGVRDLRPERTVVGSEEVMSSEKASEFLTLDVACHGTHEIVKKNDLEIREVALSLESDTTGVCPGNSEMKALYSSLEFKVSDHCVSEMGASANNVEFDMSYNEVKNEHTPQTAQFNSTKERSSDISPDTSTFVSEADAESTSNCSRVVDIGPLDGVGNKNKTENIGDPAANYFTSSNSETEMENQLTGVDSDCNVTPCNLEKDHLATPKFTCDVQDLLMVESIRTDLDLTGDTEVASSIKGGHQNKELKNPLHRANVETKLSPSTNLNEGGAFLEEEKEFHAREENLWPSQKDGGDTKSPCHEYEVAESPNHIYPERCSITPSRFISMDPLCQQTDLSLPLPTASYEFERSEPLQPICQGSDRHADASNIHLLEPQPHAPILDISVPDDNDAKDGVEDMPPLPPLPPIQWRIGKLQHDSPASRGEGTLPSFNTLSPILSEEADCIAQQGFSAFYSESTEPMNSFLQLQTTDANNPERVIQMSGKEMVQTSLSPSFSVVPATECQNVPPDHLYLPTRTGPSNLLSHLTDKDLQHDTSNSGEEMLQHTNLNLIRPSSATEDTKSQCVSLTSQDALDQSLDSLTLRQHREDGQMYHTSLELEPTIENDKLGHESQTLEGELKWQSNSSAFVSTADYEKPVGSLKSRLLRPRDPLIEAVASHDKSNLRKVTERIIPKIEPEVDERNSLLEQIRNKSFNLKPAVAMRPSIQGPKTNLKVVAILEKANAIRQALAGSDDEDDDEDSWSDS